MLKRRGKLGRNAKWLLLTEPGWSLPMPSIFYYQSIYVVALGFSEIEYGLLVSLLKGFSILTPFAAVPLASRVGFKRAFLLIDVLGNAGFLLPLVSGKRELLPLAFAAGSLIAASSILWEVLLVTGTDGDALVTAYSISSVIYITGSMLPPLAGVVMEQLGIVDGYRLVALAALTSFLAKTAVLAFTLEEPREGSSLRGVSRPSFARSIREVLSDRGAGLLLLYFMLSSILYSVFSYLSLYLHDERGARMRVEDVGLISTISSTVSLLVVLTVAVKPLNPLAYLIASATAGSLAYALYSLSSLEPKLAFAAAALSGLRGAEFSVARALFIGLLGGGVLERGHAITLSYTLGSLVEVPAPAAVGLLYRLHPVAIWLLALTATLTQIAALVLLRRASRRNLFQAAHSS
ncbi:MAG: hypothetical protein QXT50_02720 [Thermofilum sp.]